MVINTPDQRLRVFVSSTMSELAAERAAVTATIERLRLTPVLFELGARPHPPRDLYLAYIRQSHIFVGIYWEQYGWVAPGQEISGLEDEYLAAADKPKLVYLRTPAANRHPRLTDMLERIRSGGLSYRSFGDPEELAGLVADDLAVLLSERFERISQPAEADLQSPPRRLLPAATSRFIGRDQELAELRLLLADPQIRLVTVVGPGGIGKSRLALEAATAAAADFEDGAAAVMLSAVSSPELVPSAIVTALGVPETFDRPPVEALVEYLRSRTMLLLLDNVEHVIGAAPIVASLLAAAQDLTVLATSREILRLSGERVVEVPPLAVAADTGPIATLAKSGAVELFVDRARSVRRDLPYDADLVRTIAEICRRLDGLPLAIELAAAWVRVLDPSQILDRLNHRLGILVGGPRDAPERQRTLRRTMEWSYDLLDDTERVLFERLGVFTGGFSLGAVEAICVDDRVPNVLDGLASLVDKSLIATNGTLAGSPRFAMLQTLREFAEEGLDIDDEAHRIRLAHAEFFQHLVLDTDFGAGDRADPDLVQRYGADAGNLAAAMRWLVDHGHPGPVARMGLVLWKFWWVHGVFVEGIGWMEDVLAAGPLTAAERGHASLVLGMLSFGHGDYQRAIPALRAAAEQYGEIAIPRGVATASIPLGVITATTDHDAGEALLETAVKTFRELGDQWGLAFALLSLGGARMFREGFAEAVPLLEESADVARAAGTQVFLTNALVNLGLAHLGHGDLDAARSALVESLQQAATTHNRQSIARSLEALAPVALAAGDAKRGALLFGAAEGVRHSIGATVWAADRDRHQRTRDELQARLGAAEYGTISDTGRRLPFHDALQIAMANTPSPPAIDQASIIDPAPSEIRSGEDVSTRRHSDPGSDRFLITVLFVDIVGSTQRAVALGDHGWRSLLEAYLGMARRELERFAGTEIDTAGDGLFASFDRPSRGVVCASAIRDAAGAFGLEVRAGLHTGEAAMIGGKIGGVTVHVAARVAALAEPNEVLATRTVMELMAGAGIGFHHRGDHTLKGLTEQWTLYRVDV